MVKAGIWKDYLFPRRCVVCDDITDKPGEAICRGCVKKIVYIKEPCCIKCGKELKEQEREFCDDCRKREHKFIAGSALYDYGSMSDSVYRFKNKDRREYAEFYGRELAVRRGRWLEMIKPDALIPVPIHSSRKRARGYNQAELIAEVLSEYTGIPVNASLIARCKRTKPLKNLTGKERQNNLKKAFKIIQNDVKLDTIVIIDDVYTTGSTLDAMTRVLQSAGISNVYFLTLTIGRGI